ncbi:hypothetical protein ATCC90586_007426 [Pythium insidiosum]|nr:hypothetical protein ATCC90586_007426 [Pythium insidiosum]
MPLTFLQPQFQSELKSKSTYAPNRAETRLLALQADLDVAEFWLEVAAKNLEDVGRRTELQDWRFKKLEEGTDIEELFSASRLGLHSS